jgi:hypothetical protein
MAIHRAVGHLVSVIKPVTLKALIESKLEMDKSELKKNLLEFVGYLKKMAIIHDEHCHVVEHKNTGDSGMKNTDKSSDAGGRSSGHNTGGSSHRSVINRRLTVIERSPDMEGRRTRRENRNSRPGSRRLALTRRSVRERSTICPTVLTGFQTLDSFEGVDRVCDRKDDLYFLN